MLNWANRFSIFLCLDSNNYQDEYSRYECLLAVGQHDSAIGLAALQAKFDESNDWWFGHIGYDYKNQIEKKLSSRNEIKTGWSEFSFFNPEYVLYVDKTKSTLTIESLGLSPEIVFNTISNLEALIAPLPQCSFTQRIDKQVYLDTIQRLRQHIADGDCYEINFCNEGYTTANALQPLAVFNKLSELSPAPFAAFYRLDDKYMICASPERYICKQDSTILSQPIKGTARRDVDKARDEVIKQELHNSIKDRAENVMIVDLVRNDLARSCETGSVKVDELFGIYSFPQVHQMISTISGQLRNNVPFTEAIRYSFPMGSMTGAPKIKVMQLIDNYEQSRRELFSGTVGYITPQADFDFNVIIRSLFYNSTSGYLSYQTGGAITYDSIPEQEWEEMRLKAWALERIFS
ncbi:MAG: anthranilate synthase component I family protein [Bacteroidetes bacterium]|nr:anthranilate synthase component I family protein [Bacteroidota bacterium]